MANKVKPDAAPEQVKEIDAAAVDVVATEAGDAGATEAGEDGEAAAVDVAAADAASALVADRLTALEARVEALENAATAPVAVSDESEVQITLDAELDARRIEQEKADAAAVKAAQKHAKGLIAKQEREREEAVLSFNQLVGDIAPPLSVLTVPDAPCLDLRIANDETFVPGHIIELTHADLAPLDDGKWTVVNEITLPDDLPPMTATKAVLIAEGGDEPVLVLVSPIYDLPVGGGRRSRIPGNSLLLSPINARPPE
jgi:hypothetical protein